MKSPISGPLEWFSKSFTSTSNANKPLPPMTEKTGPNDSRGDFRLVDIHYHDLPIRGPVTGGFLSSDESQLRPESLEALLERFGRPLLWTKVKGESMAGADICPGDLLIFTNKITPRPGHIVGVLVEGYEPLVKRLKKGGVLVSEYRDRKVREKITDDAQIFGVLVHQVRCWVTRYPDFDPTTDRM